MKRTHHFEQRIAQRGITQAMIKFTLDNGEIKGDKFVTTKKMVRKIVSSMNMRMNKLNRLKKKFENFDIIRLINKAIDNLVQQKSIALKVIAKGGVVVVMADDALITAYDVDSYNKY